MNFCKKSVDALLHFLYSPTCLHCDEEMNLRSQRLCDSCSSLLTLLELQPRCITCFTDEDLLYPTLCRSCAEQESSLYRVAAALDYAGPAVSLVKKLKYGNQTHLAKGAAALLVAQLVRLGWPMPDIITSTPQPLLKRLLRGYNQSELLALEMGKMLNCPAIPLLVRRSGDFPQASLNHEKRQQLSIENIFLKKRTSFQGKKLLLIDDVLTTGATLQRCGEVLQEGAPGCIYALALCKSFEKNC